MAVAVAVAVLKLKGLPLMAGEMTEELVAQFRAKLAETPRVKGGALFEPEALQSMSNSDCRRFLCARDGRLDAAVEMARAALDWRLRVRPGHITPEDIPISLPQGCWRFAGWARDGRPIMLIRAELWRPNEYTCDEYNKYVGYMMDNNIARAKKGVDKQIVIFDMHGFSALQSNLTMIRTLITINQEYYPERLSLGVLVNVPWLFHAIWKVIYPWIDHKTRTKIKLLGRNDNIADILLEHIDADVLGVEYGGRRKEPYPIPPTPDTCASDSSTALATAPHPGGSGAGGIDTETEGGEPTWRPAQGGPFETSAVSQ